MIGIVFRVYTMYNYIIHTALNLVMLRNVATVDCTCINQYKFKDRKLKTESNQLTFDMLFQHLLGAALWTFQESIFCKQTWK